MFDKITMSLHEKLEEEINKVKQRCNEDPDICEMVRYLIACEDERDKYNHASIDARIGGALHTFMWEIWGVMGSGNMETSWASDLNSFIGNVICDDDSFDFDMEKPDGVFRFRRSGENDRCLQDPRILIEAARANVTYYDIIDRSCQGVGKIPIMECAKLRRAGHKVDPSKVLALLKDNE